MSKCQKSFLRIDSYIYLLYFRKIVYKKNTPIEVRTLTNMSDKRCRTFLKMALKPTNYICSDHQHCFHLKFQRGVPISTTFKNEKSDDIKYCAKCRSESASIYCQIHSTKAVSLKDYITNWMNFEGKRVT